VNFKTTIFRAIITKEEGCVCRLCVGNASIVSSLCFRASWSFQSNFLSDQNAHSCSLFYHTLLFSIKFHNHCVYLWSHGGDKSDPAASFGSTPRIFSLLWLLWDGGKRSIRKCISACEEARLIKRACRKRRVKLAKRNLIQITAICGGCICCCQRITQFRAVSNLNSPIWF
jgi:hypothetical protein